MDGRELCRRIRSLPDGEKSEILMMITCDTYEDIRAAMEAGADECLSKPLCMEWVRERLGTLIHRNEL